MSLPEFPLNPKNMTRDDVINQIISSIAMEELGLSHIINAEGEKLQYVLGTLSGASGLTPTIDELLKVNESVQSTLSTSMQNQVFLQNKMSAALSAATLQGETGATGAEGPPAVTEYATFFHNASSTYADGDLIALPLGTVWDGIGIDAATRRVITLGEKTTYNISVSVQIKTFTTSPRLHMVINGASVDTPSLNISTIGSHSANYVIRVAPNSTLSFQVQNGTAITDDNFTGATAVVTITSIG
jgi:hypothetical protein